MANIGIRHDTSSGNAFGSSDAITASDSTATYAATTGVGAVS